MRTYLAVRGWGAIELSSKGPQSHGWMVRHPLITAVLIIVALVWAGSALGITSNADPDDGERSERNAAPQESRSQGQGRRR